MPNTNRDKYLCQDYRDGKDINELARSYGISERRVAQILRKQGVTLRARSLTEKKPLSAEHARIGMHLYNYRFDRGIEPYEASLQIGWSMLKLRKVEKGVSELELLDLLDIAAYSGVELGELICK